MKKRNDHEDNVASNIKKEIQEASDDIIEDQRRLHRLELNRMSARERRRRKKLLIGELQQAERDLLRQYKELKVTNELLKREIAISSHQIYTDNSNNPRYQIGQSHVCAEPMIRAPNYLQLNQRINQAGHVNVDADIIMRGQSLPTVDHRHRIVSSLIPNVHRSIPSQLPEVFLEPNNVERLINSTPTTRDMALAMELRSSVQSPPYRLMDHFVRDAIHPALVRRERDGMSDRALIATSRANNESASHDEHLLSRLTSRSNQHNHWFFNSNSST
mmetsp:Transcript_4784/g.5768  ORF Transcript_4784/g.5768 Transcript_4784/m.5768 type:complete len:274 (+) Transcript_4784:48-869(+)